MYSPAFGRATLFFIRLDDLMILLDQYVNFIQFIRTTERLKVVIAMGLTSSHTEQRS